MSNNTFVSVSLVLSAYFIVCFCLFFPQSTTALHGGGSVVPGKHGTVVTLDQRRVVVSTEFGEISTVKVSDGKEGFYDLQFITMEPNSLFVPVHLHSDMVFYVNSGNGTLSWVDLGKEKGKLRQVELRTGDVYRLPTGSFFYMQSNLESDRRKFRINAIFSDSREEIRVCIQTEIPYIAQTQKHHIYIVDYMQQDGSSFGAYSSLADLLLGFDDKVLQAALNVDEVVIQELRSGGPQQMIVHGVSKAKELFEVHYRNMRAFLGLIDDNGMIEVNKNKKGKAFNILEAKHDFENCNGWSLVVTSKQMDALRDSDFGIFMVNLTKGAMMGPHWNPLTAEIAVALSGRGMVHVVCPSTLDEAECKNSRFRVEEGDVFVVPRYHPMAQISFNNGSFVFMGFTTTQKNNHPQYLVGSASVFQVLDKRVLAASLGVSNTTMDELLSAQNEAIILECTSCAEEEERLMEEEIQRQKEEEAREREEEERKKEEEEEAKRQEEEARREEEEARKREEEEAAAKREEEEARKREEEEARKREEEEAKREQEAKRRQEEEEEAAREQEEARKREEEEAARREQEEQEAKRRHEEEEAAQEQEEEAERRWQEEEESARQKREQEEAAGRQQEEEEEAVKKREQEDAARRQQEEEAAAREQKQQEEAARQQEEAMRRQQEEAARQQEAAMRRQQEEEASRQQEEAMRRQQEEATSRQQEEASARQQEEAMRRKREEEASRQQEEEARGREEEQVTPWGGGGSGSGSGGSGHQAQGEGEAASMKEEEMAHRAREADQAASRRREPGGGIKTEIATPQSMQASKVE
ncbi:putative rmlC-like cupin domain superfamily, rmlC-like jelly roll protein [Helianthus annuus]|nr:putative rmlC-like cupin domain superfamily, rmlC-like jelly roll protein [Helianthus annuus]KAJ0607222.1 putative rmlC-like cupin domain superfamily, rmlC-like jelly roll protein [Helianthus annuus]KAJ0767280.1 putative rmlC-like cupin domain superfamily, rmlC-like jelly roll protein [Helianthus annuus]KAJ0773126.1 putative rmlC-like cupin domain superfamily, rmlC-like jelly roll protein [Helianthus annuus]